MKSSKLIIGALAALGLTAGMASAQAEANRDAIAERLKPVGELCLQGEDCGTASAAGSEGGGDSGSNGADGESIYGSVCAACHDSGAAGAPVRGDEAAWSDRADQGFETLLDHAINGIGAMPARGGNPNLSDEEVQAALAHLVEPVMDVPDLGGDEATAEEEAPVAAEEEIAAAEEDASADDAATEEDAATDAADSGLDGAELYAGSACVACHASGAAGAPIIGDAEAWGPRIDKGVEALYESAINGIGAMPPKGGAMALSDEEVKAIVDYMVSQAQ